MDFRERRGGLPDGSGDGRYRRVLGFSRMSSRPAPEVARSRRSGFMVNSRTSQNGGTGLNGPCGSELYRRMVGLGLHRIAAALALEFAAPVGIFEPSRCRWDASSGLRQSSLPQIDDALRSKLVSDDLLAGQVMLCAARRTSAESGWYLRLLALRAAPAGICWVPVARCTNGLLQAQRPIKQPVAGRRKVGIGLPRARLCAWGREVANRLREAAGKMEPCSVAPGRDEESERQVVGRLIRRLRISDPPQDFQSIATTVLRTSLNLEAVAWVPKSASEPVVTSGRAPGLDAQIFRALPARSARESTFIQRCSGTNGNDGGSPASLRSFASVAAGSLGWLLAVNPLDDRALAPADIERMQFIGSLIATQLSNVKIYAEIKELLFGIIRALTAAIDAKDPYTSGHSERVARIAVRLAEELGMPPPKRSDLYLAGLLHDVGKIGDRRRRAQEDRTADARGVPQDPVATSRSA